MVQLACQYVPGTDSQRVDVRATADSRLLKEYHLVGNLRLKFLVYDKTLLGSTRKNLHGKNLDYVAAPKVFEHFLLDAPLPVGHATI